MANSFSFARSRDQIPSFSLLWSLCRLLWPLLPAQPLVKALATQGELTGSGLIGVHQGYVVAAAATPVACSRDGMGMG